MTELLNDYVRLSRTPWYSLIFILPLVALYEALAVMVNWASPLQLRNGADVLLRQLLELFGLSTPYVLGLVFAAGAGVTWFWQRRRYGTTRVVVGYLAGMLFESVVWAVFLLLALYVADQFLMIGATDTVLRTAFLAVGAGIYEEGVFRLILITALVSFFQGAMDWQWPIARGVAIGLAAVLFALFHYVGVAGEAFAWNSFGYRSVAGVILGLLFMLRGFGITVYAHTIYDLLVLGLQTIQLDASGMA